MSFKGFIFDLDGTLLNTLPIVRTSLSRTLLKFSGREYTDEELSSVFGPSEDGIFKRLFPEQWKESLRFYLEEYERLHTDFGEPFPGITETLLLLQKRNMKLALVSGKGAGSMEISLKHSGLKPYFETIITGSEEGASKTAHIRQILAHWPFSPEEIAYVGDIAYDVQAAREAGVVPISALWAETAQPHKVLAMNPAFAFNTVTSFQKWIATVT